jgi:hypothetical protein
MVIVLAILFFVVFAWLAVLTFISKGIIKALSQQSDINSAIATLAAQKRLF